MEKGLSSRSVGYSADIIIARCGHLSTVKLHEKPLKIGFSSAVSQPRQPESKKIVANCHICQLRE